MPRLITTPRWGCDFRCGYVSPKKANIEKHEKTCFRDPAKRACKTCKHDRIRTFTDDAPEKWCEAGARPEGAEAVTGCEAWEPNARARRLMEAKP